MMIVSLKRGLAAGTISALLALAAGPVMAQVQRPVAQKTAQAKPAQKKTTTAKPAAKAAAGAAAAAGSAQAATGPGGASLIASYGDWGVYTAQSGRSKICYALTQPKDRLPKNLNRDPAYLFVSFRPAENVKNEVAVVLGFPAKENGPAEAAIGDASYALLTKEGNAWLKNPAEEGQAITAMIKGANLTLKTQSARGNSLMDLYSLSGFSKALDHARKECVS
ncbi:invasion associated locus B family protein [Microvirga roseola]|uniref:hypothetical protein n=1 Tax=Microvirga roseola TaxID=2883126 RepID=UPI001E54A477|nr:hypothetical protein [Microvirga roseola]